MPIIQKNELETRTSSPQSKLQAGLHVSTTPIQYSRNSLRLRNSTDDNSTVTVTPEGQKDIQKFSQNPDIDERGKVLYL